MKIMFSLSPGIATSHSHQVYGHHFQDQIKLLLTVCTFNLELLSRSHILLPLYISSQLTVCPHFHFLWPTEAINGNKSLSKSSTFSPHLMIPWGLVKRSSLLPKVPKGKYPLLTLLQKMVIAILRLYQQVAFTQCCTKLQIYVYITESKTHAVKL